MVLNLHFYFLNALCFFFRKKGRFTSFSVLNFLANGSSLQETSQAFILLISPSCHSSSDHKYETLVIFGFRCCLYEFANEVEICETHFINFGVIGGFFFVYFSCACTCLKDGTTVFYHTSHNSCFSLCIFFLVLLSSVDYLLGYCYSTSHDFMNNSEPISLELYPKTTYLLCPRH